MKALIISFFCIIFLLFSCKNEIKSEFEENENQTSNSKVVQSSNHIDDSIAKQMMEMFGKKGETFHDMMNTDSLQTEIDNMFSSEGLQQLLKSSNLSDKEQQQFIEKMLKISNRSNNGNGRMQNDTKEAMDAYFKELESVLVTSGSKQQVKDLQSMLEKQNVQSQLDGNSEVQSDPQVDKIRAIMDTKNPTIIEHEMTRSLMYGYKERRDVWQNLSVANKKESKTILSDYLQVTKTELELLKQIPARQDILSETVARQRFEEQVPATIKGHNASGNASPRFKSMTEYFYQEQKGRANTFIQKSNEARKKFYAENPGWYGEKSESGDTYVDSRYEWIYLPLGALSFADRVVSHDIGKGGSNSQGSIGEPDFALELFNKPDPRICNLGTKGVLILEFTDNAIVDVNGPDLYVFEMGKIEPTNLEISKDGKTWINVGKIEGGTAKVDIAPFIKKGETFNYIKLTDLDTWSELPGADVDAVAAIGGALRLNLDSAVLFDTGKFQLKDSAFGELKKLVDAIKAIPKAKIVVEGHTDNVGNPTSNKILSQNRAKEVSNYLKHNLSSSYSFEIKGYGESQPIAANDTDAHKQKNRRVEILVIPN